MRQVEVKAKRGDVLFYDILTAHSGSENLAAGAAESTLGPAVGSNGGLLVNSSETRMHVVAALAQAVHAWRLI